jgi:hypothetical protein
VGTRFTESTPAIDPIDRVGSSKSPAPPDNSLDHGWHFDGLGADANRANDHRPRHVAPVGDSDPEGERDQE